MKKLISYIIGAFLLIMSFSSFGENAYLNFALFFVAGLMCFPVVLDKINNNFISKYYIPIVVFLFILGANLNKSDVKEGDVKKNEVVNKDKVDENVKKEQASNQLKKTLQKEISFIDEPFDETKYRGSIEKLQIEKLVFQLWANNIDAGGKSEDIEIKKLSEILKKKVIQRQIKEFPKMREYYGKYLAEKLWENNIYVSTQGKSDQIINLTGGLFANNKNIKEFQETLNAGLNEFRFKEVRFRWYENAEQYTFYKLETPSDNVLLK
jgi:hypothetical protein